MKPTYTTKKTKTCQCKTHKILHIIKFPIPTLLVISKELLWKVLLKNVCPTLFYSLLLKYKRKQ